ncbi:MAG: phage tail terminator protein [Rhodoferax sp.]
MSALAHFLALEQVLIARLSERLADVAPRVHVLGAVDLAGVSESSQPTPAVHVIYQGYRVVEIKPDGNCARVEQTWLATVATNNKAALRTGSAARADAGVIAQRVCQALMGFKPVGALSKPLRLAEGPGAGFSSGYQYLPLAFVAELLVSNS